MKIEDLIESKITVVKNQDISKYADDLLGPDMAGEIRMIPSKRKIARTIDRPAEEEEEVKDLGMLGLKDDLNSRQGTDEPEPEDADEEITHAHVGFNPEAGYSDHNERVVVSTDIPGIVRREVKELDPIVPKYHQVRDLSDEMREPIRALSRVFEILTSTNIDNIQVLANANGSGPNSEEELDATTKWIKQRGERDNSTIKAFHEAIPGIHLHLEIYKTDGITHLLNHDEHGQFIYSWPSAEDVATKGAQGQVGLDDEQLS